MTILKFNSTLLTILTIAACGQSEHRSTEKIMDSSQATNQVDTLLKNLDEFQLLTPNQFTPLSFIDAVTIKDENDTLINTITMADVFPIDWVKQTDLDTLMSLIKSTEKCKCFVSPLSSYSGLGTKMSSDIGGYAIVFINSIRHKTKIEFGLYSCPQTNKESVEEISKWWTSYKQDG